MAPTRAADGFFHPGTEDELVALVALARAERRQLRVRGSAHSIPDSIYTDDRLEGRAGGIDVMLDRYDGVTFDVDRMQVIVQAGCHLGVDPRDPTHTSTRERSLLAQLEARGWALPDLGGVSHQTVAGFLMTGSCGGTVRYALEDAIVAFRFVDGTGTVRVVERGRDELFDAFACSLGLLGVVSTVTFACEPRYDIAGQERITTEDGCDYDLFGGGPDGLAAFLRDTDYARLMWWPQRGVQRVATWQARRVQPSNGQAAPPRKPYRAFGEGIPWPSVADRASLATQWVGGKFYDLADHLDVVHRRESVLTDRVLPAVLRQFVALDGGKPQQFCDTWCDGLPMDNAMSEASLPTTFTEIWVPLDDAAEVMALLREHFRTGGLSATGLFIFEIYAARAHRAWLHPGYGRDSLRIDVFWFGRNHDDPRETFFPQFWDLLAPYGYRLHWGKILPNDADRGARYLARQLPRWDDFLRVRHELDPDDIFLTDHFRHALGIEGARERRSAMSTIDTDTLPARMQRFYEDLAVQRTPMLDRLGDVFTDDIHFVDPFRDTHGMPPFRRLFERMFKHYPHVAFTGFECVGTDEAFTLTYDMHLRMRVGPDFVTPMASVCRTRDGKVSHLVDYYDMGSSLVSPFSPMRAAYRGFINKLFL